MSTTTESWATTPGTARSMRSNRGRDTSPELRVRRELNHRGHRYRVDFAPLPGLRSRADIVFTRGRVAVYLDGCFWHCCPEHGVSPVANPDYWIPKLARNKERDAEAASALQAAGWAVLRFWEHESTALVVNRIVEVRRDRRSDVGLDRITARPPAMGHAASAVGSSVLPPAGDRA